MLPDLSVITADELEMINLIIIITMETFIDKFQPKYSIYYREYV